MVLKDLWLVLTGRLSSEAITELAQTSVVLGRECAQWRNHAEDTMKQLLHIDEDIYRMSQCTTHLQLTGILGSLVDQAMTRRKHLSDRVGDVSMRKLKQHFASDSDA